MLSRYVGSRWSKRAHCGWEHITHYTLYLIPQVFPLTCFSFHLFPIYFTVVNNPTFHLRVLKGGHPGLHWCPHTQGNVRSKVWGEACARSTSVWVPPRLSSGPTQGLSSDAPFVDPLPPPRSSAQIRLTLQMRLFWCCSWTENDFQGPFLPALPTQAQRPWTHHARFCVTPSKFSGFQRNQSAVGQGKSWGGRGFGAHCQTLVKIVN